MIIVLKDKKKVTFAFSNWIIGMSNCKHYLMEEENLPYRTYKDKHLIVASDETNRSSDVLLCNKKFMSLIYNHTLNHDYIVRSVIPELKRIIYSEELVDKDSGKWSNNLFIANNKNIWRINRDFYVEEYEDFCAWGCGSYDFLMGILDNNRHLPTEDRIADVIQNYGLYANDDLYPVAIVDTMKLTNKFVSEL